MDSMKKNMTSILANELLKEDLRKVLALVSEGEKSRLTPGRIILKLRNQECRKLTIGKKNF